MTEKDPLGIVGELIGEKYRVERFVGEGGFAVVYRAFHLVWEHPVAVKLFSSLGQVPAENRDALQRDFVREGALLAELSSLTAGVVQARDVGTLAGPSGQWMPYIVLEWLDGVPLDAVLDKDQAEGVPWTEDQVLGFLLRLLPILQVAHERGISHRDIKPANVFVMGSAPRSPATPLKVLDFGVAKMVSDHTKTKAALAKTGVAVTSFTPNYGSPEQFTRAYGATGPWTDVYTTALVASEMLVGRTVLEGEDVVQLGFSTANPVSRPTPQAFGVEISDSFEAVLAKALAINPDDRYPSASEFLRACMAVARERGVSVWPSSLPLEMAERVRVSESTPPLRRMSLLARAGCLDQTQHASASTVAPPRPMRDSPLGVALVVLVALVGGTLVYSATDLRGAEETRAGVLAVARASKRLLGMPRDGARRLQEHGALEGAVAVASEARTRSSASPGASPRRTAFPAVPPGADTDDVCPEGAAGIPLEDVPGVLCLHEEPVRGAEYATCGGCSRIEPGSTGAMASREDGPSTDCVAREPSLDEDRACVTAEQARAFCESQQSRLPTQHELEAFAATRSVDPSRVEEEWSISKGEVSGDERRGFRCVFVAG